MKNVLITGAGRGIGLALTKEFYKNGYHVIGTYRNEKSAGELLDLAKSTEQVSVVKADVTDEKSLVSLKEKLSQVKSIDVLINNSGVIGDRNTSLMKIDFQKFSQVLDVNTLGPMRVCQLVIPFMKSGGTVAHISSMMGSIDDNASGGYYDYRMSKTAVNMFNKCLSIEFPHLSCIVLHPGWVQTDMGGAGATVPPQESAKGIFNILKDASAKQSGRFFDFRGKEIPW